MRQVGARVLGGFERLDRFGPIQRPLDRAFELRRVAVRVERSRARDPVDDPLATFHSLG